MTAPTFHNSPTATALTHFPAEKLLSALSHEVANHLTAVRMHAELFELGHAPSSSSDAVLHTAGRAGALNACISPLANPGPPRSSISPLALIDRLRERLSTTYDSRFPLTLHSCQAMRSARGELEECVRALSLLAIELHCATDEQSPVSLAANANGDHAEISLTVQSSRLPLINAAHPGTGVVLALHIAEAIARRHEGWVSLHSLPHAYSVAFCLPGE